MPKFLPPVGVIGAYRAKRINAATATTQAIGALVDASSSSVVAGAGSATIAITAATAPTPGQKRPNKLPVVSHGPGTPPVIQGPNVCPANPRPHTRDPTA